MLDHGSLGYSRINTVRNKYTLIRSLLLLGMSQNKIKYKGHAVMTSVVGLSILSEMLRNLCISRHMNIDGLKIHVITVFVKVPGTKLQYCKGTEIENHRKMCIRLILPYSEHYNDRLHFFCLLHINTTVKQITKKW